MKRGKKNIQGGSYLCCPVYGPALHGDQCTSGCEAHTNFAEKIICLMADNMELREIINFVTA
jgi:hypothetical protein